MAYTNAQQREHIYELQTALYELYRQGMPLPRINPDGIYGAETTRAVREFQRQRGLPVTGNADRETWVAIFAAYTAVRGVNGKPLPITPFRSGPIHIRRGQTGSGVGLAQVMLNSLSRVMSNLSAVPVNFIYDDKTIEQMRIIRRLSGLPESDVLDVLAWNALTALYQQTAEQGL